MKRSGSFDAKRKLEDDERISSRRSSKALMDSISKQIEKLRDERKALSIAWATEKNKEKEEALNGAIDKLDEEIQAKEAELKDVTKEYKEATQAMEIEESGALRKTEIETARKKYNNDFKLLFETKIEKIEDPTGRDRKYGILRWNREILRNQHSQVVYCRSCYFEIAGKIKELLQSGNVDKFLITGMLGG
eukprot:jgi/Bigna1/127224/aug1.4_g1932